MTTQTSVDIADGKYSVILRDDGTATALRYGEPWPSFDITGLDNLHTALAREVIDLREKLASFAWLSDLYGDRALTHEKVAAEIADYRVILDNVGKVYCHVTGGMISKANTLANAVIAVADDHVTSLVNEEVKERTERLRELAGVAIRFIRENDLEENEVVYDEATCDGECLAGDIESALEEIAQ